MVVGAGPAGLAAAMGCALAGMSTVTLDREGPGGHAAQATRLEHYLGYLTGVTGTELMSPGARPGSGGRARLVSPCAVLSLTPSTDASTLSLADGSELSARAVIVASGATYPTADRPGWQEFGGRGVYYADKFSAADVTKSVLCRPEFVHARRPCRVSEDVAARRRQHWRGAVAVRWSVFGRRREWDGRACSDQDRAAVDELDGAGRP